MKIPDVKAGMLSHIYALGHVPQQLQTQAHCCPWIRVKVFEQRLWTGNCPSKDKTWLLQTPDPLLKNLFCVLVII